MRFFLSLLFFCFLTVTTAMAAEPNALVQKAQDYMNNIEYMQTRFLITGANGSATSGTFYLKRPGRLRFEYDDFGDYIVADGLMVHMWDADSEQASQAPIGSTLADFILKKNITFDGDVTVTGSKKIDSGHIAITMVQTEDPGAGEMTMLFETEPMRLVKWRVVDALGKITETALTNHQYPERLDPTLFVFKEPKGHGEAWEDR